MTFVLGHPYATLWHFTLVLLTSKKGGYLVLTLKQYTRTLSAEVSRSLENVFPEAVLLRGLRALRFSSQAAFRAHPGLALDYSLLTLVAGFFDFRARTPISY